jgi:hypothetical protein
MDIEIATTMARLDDDTEMTKFLCAIPDGGQLAKLLQERNPVSTRAYEDAAFTARFVESDGNIVMCFKVAPITIDQAEMIEIKWEGNTALSDAAFRNTVEQALSG